MFGEGARTARLMLVGEQPAVTGGPGGDSPSSAPPAACSTARSRAPESTRRIAYVTNVVKHFKWTPRGKRRIHAKPNWSEIAACRPWLDAELAVVRPQVLVALGATAAASASSGATSA